MTTPRLRWLRRDDRGAALIMSLIVITLASVLSLSVAGAILAQVKPSQLTRKLTATVSAAEAGIDVAQRRIRRGEADGLLPCGPFTGDIAGDGARYNTIVQYYKDDPTGKPDGWLEDSSVVTHRMPCPAGGISTASVMQWWALVTSTGSTPDIPGTRPGAANRTLSALITPLQPTCSTCALVSPGSLPGQSGDGWEALFMDERNVYNIFHHYGDTSLGQTRGSMIDCHQKSNGDRCPNFPTYASGSATWDSPVPFGLGPDNLYTSMANSAAVDYTNGRAYIAAGRGEYEIGVACLDFRAKQSCGFFPVATVAIKNQTWLTQVSGGTSIGTKFFLAGPTGLVYCFNYATQATCAGYPSGGIAGVDFVSPPPGTPDHWFAPAVPANGSLKSFDNRYVFGSMHNSQNPESGKSITCIDITANQRCPGFPRDNVSPVSTPYVQRNLALLPVFDASSTSLTGVCTTAATEADQNDARIKCFYVGGSTSGQDMATPPFVAALGRGDVGVGGIQDVLLIGRKVYIAMSLPDDETPKHQATYTCWDFSTQAVCDGFTPRSTSGQMMAPYTIRQDPYNRKCGWVLGHVGRMEILRLDSGQINPPNCE